MNLTTAERIWELISQRKELEQKVDEVSSKCNDYENTSYFFNEYEPPKCTIKVSKNGDSYIHIKNQLCTDLYGDYFNLYFDALDNKLVNKLKKDKDLLLKAAEDTVNDRLQRFTKEKDYYEKEVKELNAFIENEL